MAFATTNVQVGSIGDAWRLSGKFTSSVGDADGTVSVGGALVTSAHFYDASDTTPTTQPLPIKMSTNSTTGVTTITVNVSNGVVDGRFSVIYK